MKSLKDLRTQIDEVLTKKDPAAKWIHDFVHSDNPKFAGKSMAKRRQMALAAYYSNKNEAAFVSTSMQTDIKGDLKEAFLSKKEQDDLDNLPSDDFVKKYGHAKHVHRKSHATKATDVEKFTESQEEDDRRGAEHHQKELEQQQQELEAKKKKEKVKEEVEQIDELSKNTLSSYVKKAHKDNALTANDLGHQLASSKRPGLSAGTDPTYTKGKTKYLKRSAGIDTAVTKLAKEATEYKGIGTDVVDKKKVLNPPIPLTQKKKTVKDFKEDLLKKFKTNFPRVGVYAWGGYPWGDYGYSGDGGDAGGMGESLTVTEQIDEGDNGLAAKYGEAKVYDPFTKKMVATKPIKVQAGGGATRNGVPVETGPSKHKSRLPMSKAAGVLAAEEVELIQRHEVKESRGHKVIAAFLKNREVAQRAFTGQNKPAEKKPEPEKKEVKEGFDDYHAIAKELVKRHGKNVDTGHINDLAGERDSHRGLDHSEVMHHVNKLLNAKKEVKEGEVYDEKWKKFKKIKEGVSMLKFNDFLKEAWQEGAGKAPMQEKLVGKQHKLDKNKNGKLDADDFKKLRNEGKKCMDEDDMDESGLRMAAHAAHKSGKKEFEFKGKTYPVKVQKEEAELEEAKQGLWANIHAKRERIKRGSGEKMRKPGSKGAPTDKALKDSQESVQIDELSKKTLGSYVNKAAKDSRIHGQIATDFENTADKARKQSKKDSFERLNRKYLGKAWKREDGIATAVKKLTKEDVQLDEGKMKELAMNLKDMSHDEFHKTYGKPKSHFDPTSFKKPVQKGHEMERAKELAQRGMKSLTKEEIERIEEISKNTLGSYIKGAAKDIADRQERIRAGARPHPGESQDDFKKDMSKALALQSKRKAGMNKAVDKLTKEEVEQVSEDNHAMSYVNATLAVMDEGKLDDLRDAQKLRATNKSAYDKDYKADTSHPHITTHKGTSYGGQAQKDDEGDEKPENQEKRGRGRPSGSKSGARQKGNGREDGGIPVHNLHLPNRNK